MTDTEATMLERQDVDDAISDYRRGLIPLRAVAWVYKRWRNQIHLEPTAPEFMAETGASQTAAYRAFQALAAPPSDQDSRISGTDRDSRISGTKIPGKRESNSRKAGNLPLRRDEIKEPPYPPEGEPSPGEKYPASPQADRDAALALVDRINFNYRDWCIESCAIYPAAWVAAIARKMIPGTKRSIDQQVRYMNGVLVRWVRDGPDEWASAERPRNAPGGRGPGEELLNFNELLRQQERSA